MAKPDIDDVSFPKLSKSSTSKGTVTGSSFTTGDTVTIYGKKKNRRKGTVKDKAVDKTWNAEVDYVKEKKDGKGLEAISVTVTNTLKETSDPEPSMSDIID